MRELFLGNFRLDLIHPFPLPGAGAARVRRLLRAASTTSCATRSTPPRSTPPASTRSTCSTGLRQLGAFGMKIPRKYGGLGFTNVEYSRVMKLLGSVDGNLGALLSAHQSIGVPQPLKLFGTEEQKQSTCRAAPRARSRPSRSPSRTSAPTRRGSRPRPRRPPDGDAYVLNGDEALVHERHPREAARGHGRRPRDQEDQRLRRRDRLAGRQGRAPLPLHGPAGARERRDHASRTCACPPRT